MPVKHPNTATAPPDDPAAFSDVVTVEKPTVGRVVLVNVAGFNVEPVWRPAFVLATDVLDHPDAVTVALFATAVDFPLPPGCNVRQPEVGTPAYPAKAGWQIEHCRYGSGPGEWSWPIRLEQETFEVAVLE